IGLAAMAMVLSDAFGPQVLPICWLGLAAVVGFTAYALRGSLVIAVLAWFASLICLHEEFWRSPDAFVFALTIPRILIGVLLALFVAMLALRRFRPRLAWPIGGLLLLIVLYFSLSAAASGFETRSPVTVHYRLI